MNGILLVVVLLVIQITTTIIYKLAGDRTPLLLQPTSLLTIPWILASIIYALPIFIYREQLNVIHVMYIAAAHSAFAAGAVLAGLTLRTAPKISETLDDGLTLSARAFIILLILGLLGNIAVTVDAVYTSSLSLLERVGGDALSTVRNEQFATQMLGIVGPFHRFEQLAPLGLLSISLWIFLPRSDISEKYKRLINILFPLVVLSLLFNGLFIRGGRMDLVILLFVICISIALDPSRKAINWVKSRSAGARALMLMVIFLTAIGGVTYLSTGFVAQRSAGTSGLLSLTQHHRLDVTPETLRLVGTSDAAQYGLLTLSYVTSPLSTFGYYFDLRGGALPGPFWGQYNFPMLAPRVMRVLQFEEIRYWWDIRFDIFEPLMLYGYGGNVWATILRDLAVDFGWFGAIVFMGIFGFASKRLVRAAIDRKAYLLYASYAVLSPILILSFAHSLFFVQSVFAALFFALLISAWVAVRRRSATKGSSPRATRRVRRVI
jgi:hypothetical protein